MRKTLLLLAVITTGAFGATVQSAAAYDPLGDDSLMCTLAKKGIIDPDSGPWCGPHNPPSPGG